MKKRLFTASILLLAACSNASTPFAAHGNKNGFPSYFGTVEVTGYASTQKVSEAFCYDNCPLITRVFFNLSPNDNKNSAQSALDEFIINNAGNSFVGENAVALGCLENDLIHYQNDGKQHYDTDLSSELSQVILSSTEENPITLKLIKEEATLAGKGEVNDCYSHFSHIEKVE